MRIIKNSQQTEIGSHFKVSQHCADGSDQLKFCWLHCMCSTDSLNNIYGQQMYAILLSVWIPYLACKRTPKLVASTSAENALVTFESLEQPN